MNFRLGAMTSFSSLLAAGLFGLACQSEAVEASDESELQLEQAPIPTAMKELRAGQAYIPGLDEAPVASQTNPCLSNPRITNTGGNVASAATIVQSRETLSRELGVELNGTIPVLGGLTGAASLAGKTSFDQSSAAVLFQAGGTYESVVQTDVPPKSFDAAKVAECGYGYVDRASHRVTAALVVSMRSVGGGSEIRGSASLGKAGVAELKSTVAQIIQRGKVQIELRFASDVVPEMPAAPFAEAALVVGEDEASKAEAIKKIDASLKWLADGQNAIEKYLLALQQPGVEQDQAPPPAPTEKVRFRFYPQTPAPMRQAIERSSKDALATRIGMGDTATIIQSWEAFATAAADGHAHEWNILGAPLPSVDALNAKSADLLEKDGGKLRNHESALSEALESCALTLRNDANLATAEELAKAIGDACRTPAALPIDKKTHLIRPISVVSMAEKNNGRDRLCPEGLRLPTIAESKIFEPWSRVAKAKEQGVWLQDQSCLTGTGWLVDGKAECTGMFGSFMGVSVCVEKSLGAMPK
jgi:hypothetical protein